MNTVEVIIPWRGGCRHRQAALEHVATVYVAHGWDVTVSEARPRAWVKATAVTPAVEASTADILVIADADVWCDHLEAAVEQVRQGAAWAVPHRLVHRLNLSSTNAFLAGSFNPDTAKLVERPYVGYAGGGITVLRRNVYLDVPLDPRFEGWGQEDASWGCALEAIAGKPWRGDAPLWHLWHPPQDRKSRQIGSAAGMRLLSRYHRARRDPEAMRALLAEYVTVEV